MTSIEAVSTGRTSRPTLVWSLAALVAVAVVAFGMVWLSSTQHTAVENATAELEARASDLRAQVGGFVQRELESGAAPGRVLAQAPVAGRVLDSSVDGGVLRWRVELLVESQASGFWIIDSRTIFAKSCVELTIAVADPDQFDMTGCTFHPDDQVEDEPVGTITIDLDLSEA